MIYRHDGGFNNEAFARTGVRVGLGKRSGGSIIAGPLLTTLADLGGRDGPTSR